MKGLCKNKSIMINLTMNVFCEHLAIFVVRQNGCKLSTIGLGDIQNVILRGGGAGVVALAYE